MLDGPSVRAVGPDQFLSSLKSSRVRQPLCNGYRIWSVPILTKRLQRHRAWWRPSGLNSSYPPESQGPSVAAVWPAASYCSHFTPALSILFVCFLYFLVFFETYSLAIQLWLAWHSLCSPSWPHVHGSPPALASQVLRSSRMCYHVALDKALDWHVGAQVFQSAWLCRTGIKFAF